MHLSLVQASPGADRLLSRLVRVKATGSNRGAAACPLCQSRQGRPIAFRFLDDGRILLHAFCGCTTGDVLLALGLSFSDLFPERLGHHYPPERRPFDPMEVLIAVGPEITVVSLIAYDIAESGRSDVEKEERLHKAAMRLERALSMVGELPVPEEIRRIGLAEHSP